jgi:DNA-binding NtrC family response regulator
MAKRRKKKKGSKKKSGKKKKKAAGSRAAELPIRKFAGNMLRRGKSLDDIMERLERIVLETAIDSMGGNRLETAYELGISRSRLYRRMDAVGV